MGLAARVCQLEGQHQPTSGPRECLEGPQLGTDERRPLTGNIGYQLSRVAIKRFGVSDQVPHKPGCTTTEDG